MNTQKIKVLPLAEAQKIAAGEVVERPASAVKELIENALDAGATSITLILEKSGKDLIRIIDNGCGMNREDVRLCILPHATSKIEKLSDLTSITTFGFRGEALASMCAVAKVTITTAPHDAQVGTMIEVENSAIVSEKEAACSGGTDIIIRDLFYNTPVRKKFLKHDDTEWNQIYQNIQAFCLSNLNISFKVFKDDGKLALNAPAVTTLKDRVCQLWDYNLAENMTILEQDKKAAVALTGIISRPGVLRYGRHNIFVFVNGRLVKQSPLTSAFIKGYARSMSDGKYPCGVLFIQADPLTVDVNVHPRKEEVQFAKPQVVEEVIKRAVRATLEVEIPRELETPAVFQNFDYQKNLQNPQMPVFATQVSVSSVLQTLTVEPVISPFELEIVRPTEFVQRAPVNFQDLASRSFMPHPFAELEEVITSFIPLVEQKKSHHIIVGQLLDTYILIQKPDGLVMIDQHAIGERIVYENMKKRLDAQESVQLLFPMVITVEKGVLPILMREQDYLADHGIVFEQFSDTSIRVIALPVKLDKNVIDDLFAGMMQLTQGGNLEDIREKICEHLYAQVACKAAVKAGDRLSLEQMQNLIDQMEVVDNRHMCIHGRPTTWMIGRDEIEKKFRRR